MRAPDKWISASWSNIENVFHGLVNKCVSSDFSFKKFVYLGAISRIFYFKRSANTINFFACPFSSKMHYKRPGSSANFPRIYIINSALCVFAKVSLARLFPRFCARFIYNFPRSFNWHFVTRTENVYLLPCFSNWIIITTSSKGVFSTYIG